MKEMIKAKLFETKKDLVLEGVADYFGRSGFGNPKMQEIARHVGISVGALYKLFPSKDELLYEYIEYEIRRFCEELLRKGETLPGPRERLIHFVDLKLATFEAKRGAFEDPVIGDPLFFFKMNTRKKNPIEPIADYLSDQFAELARSRSLAIEDPRLTAYEFNGFVTGYIEHWFNDGVAPSRSGAEIFERFLKGLER